MFLSCRKLSTNHEKFNFPFCFNNENLDYPFATQWRWVQIDKLVVVPKLEGIFSFCSNT